ncbi:glutathione S-transferase family protein [Reyranella sp.]|uniref:glutathione S-transferase family protein n=1 Tax=Reyranella sp. TaxID=1929291 RepID=UPI003BAB122A
MTEFAKLSGARPRLYQTPSSYYSMIARLALAEGGIAYERLFVDIHFRLGQQQPDYVRLNPGMTVPTLVLADRVLTESRDIAEYALGAATDPETRAWLDLHYAYPIEELTFGGILARNPLARILIPKRLESIRRQLLAQAARNPDLASVYQARAAVFAERVEAFEPDAVVALSQQRRTEAIGFMDRLEQTLRDGRPVLVPPAYGVADVVWTVFLGRMEFAGLGAEIPKRPALARYWTALQARPSFAAADIWTKFHIGRLIGGILGIGRG